MNTNEKEGEVKRPAKIWMKKFPLTLRKANLAQSLNQGFVRFESSLHPYFTIFVGRLGNYFKLHPLFFKPIKEKGKDKDKDRVNEKHKEQCQDQNFDQ